MKELCFSIEMNASKEYVWSILWSDVIFRDWAGFIDEGTYMQGEMNEGGTVQFISSINGYGVTSYIERMIINEYVLFKHQADTMDSGLDTRATEWTGGIESYSLKENEGITQLTIRMDVPFHQEDTFNVLVPRALERIKELSELITH